MGSSENINKSNHILHAKFIYVNSYPDKNIKSKVIKTSDANISNVNRKTTLKEIEKDHKSGKTVTVIEYASMTVIEYASMTVLSQFAINVVFCSNCRVL